jgi:hypothetical protein
MPFSLGSVLLHCDGPVSRFPQLKERFYAVVQHDSCTLLLRFVDGDRHTDLI